MLRSIPVSPVVLTGLVAGAALLPPKAGAQDPSLELAYVADAVHVVRGGVRSGSAWLGNLDVVLTVEDLGSSGTSARVHVLGNHGDPLSSWVGDAQVTSNIEAPEALRIFEAWVEHDATGPGLSLLLGLYDLNSEFDAIETAGLFLNSSFGIGPDYSQTGVTGPSIFPISALAARVVWRPRPGWHVKGAVLDGVPGNPDDEAATVIDLSSRDGALLAAEIGWQPNVAARSPGPVGRSFEPLGTTRFAVGTWYYTRGFEPLLAGRTGDETRTREPRPGLYLLAENEVWSGEDVGPGLSVFARAGWSDPRFHQFGSYTGAGAVFTGLLPRRPDDRLGLGVAVAHNGGEYRELVEAGERVVAARETVVELTYRLEGSAWALQPDVQWVLDPGTDPTVDHALVVGVRGEVGFAIR